MDSNRIIRYTFPGISFAMSILLFDYVFGGRFLFELWNRATDGQIPLELLTLFATGLISTPVLGFMLSTLTHEIWKPSYLFRVPPKLETDYLKALRALAPNNVIPRDPFKKDKNILIEIHQILLRSLTPNEPLGYTQRRFTMILVHLNILGSIAAALVFAIPYNLGNDAIELKNIFKEWPKIYIILLYVIYCWYGIKAFKRNRRESNNFEIQWIIWKSEGKDPELKTEYNPLDEPNVT